MHCLSSKGKAGYEGRLFSVQKITKKETGGEPVPGAEIQPPAPRLLVEAYGLFSGHEGNASTSLENVLVTAGVRELVTLPEGKYKKGDTFKVEFDANYGRFAAEYEVTGTARILKTTCTTVKRRVSVVKAKKGVPLKIENWEEEIAFDPKRALPVSRKLKYVVTAPRQRIEATFEAEATAIEKLSPLKTKAEVARWEPAFALQNALADGRAEGIRKAMGGVDREGDFGPLVVYGEFILERIAERAKIVEGLSRKAMPENRTHYALYVPKGYDAKQAHILVLALHGSGGKAEPMAKVWEPFAEAHRAVVVAPKSLGSTWQTDLDLAVIRKILTEVRGVYNIAEGKGVLFGFSAGAAMSFTTHFFLEEHAFQAVVAACGFMEMAKLRGRINAGLEKYMPKIKDLPYYLLTGEKDFAKGGVKSDRDYLTKHGAKVNFVEVPKMGHTFSAKLMPPIQEWLVKVFE
jgi:predicted esterase